MDYLVNLYDLELDNLEVNPNYRIVRVLSPNSDRVIEFIKNNFTDNWASEAKAALYKNNPTCFIALDKANIIGFACYDATAKGFFGPTGVEESYRGKGIGSSVVKKLIYMMNYQFGSGKTLFLCASDFETAHDYGFDSREYKEGTKRLVEFYKKLGFKVVKNNVLVCYK